MLLVTGGLLVHRAMGRGVESSPLPLPPSRVSVQPNDTLWGIAREHFPNRHTGEVVFQIRTLNPKIDPANLKVGEWIVLRGE